jgi:hypothetical protein
MASAVERPDNVLPQRPNDFEKKFFGLDYIQSMGKSFPPSLRVNKSLSLVDVKLYMGAPVAAFPTAKTEFQIFPLEIVYVIVNRASSTIWVRDGPSPSPKNPSPSFGPT